MHYDQQVGLYVRIVRQRHGGDYLPRSLALCLSVSGVHHSVFGCGCRVGKNPDWIGHPRRSAIKLGFGPPAAPQLSRAGRMAAGLAAKRHKMRKNRVAFSCASCASSRPSPCRLFGCGLAPRWEISGLASTKSARQGGNLTPVSHPAHAWLDTDRQDHGGKTMRTTNESLPARPSVFHHPALIILPPLGWTRTGKIMGASRARASAKTCSSHDDRVFMARWHQ